MKYGFIPTGNPAEAGASWRLESMWEWEGVTRNYDMRMRVRSGPPKI